MTSTTRCLRLFERLSVSRPNNVASFSTTSRCSAGSDDHKQQTSRPIQISRPISLDQNPYSQPPRRMDDRQSPRTGRPRPQQGNANSAAHVAGLMSAIPSGRNQLSSTKTQTLAQQTQADWLGKSLNKQVYRRWQTGDVYAPHDLSPVEMQKWRTKGRPETDAFDALDMNPIDEYKNFSIMSDFMTPMGRIKHSRETGLRNVNQRKIAKAIRRGIGLGLLPSVHLHPEFLIREARRNQEQKRVSNYRPPL